MSKGKLYLIPNTLGGETINDSIPIDVQKISKSIRFFAVEEVKSARRLLRKIDREFPIDDSEFYTLNKKSTIQDIHPILKTLKSGANVGIISEAGCAGIADPGAILVALAHENKIQVCPTVGASSILLTLIGSGFNGQQFRFNGYLPKLQKERIQKLKELEQLANRKNETQLFMDTPFRNVHVLEDLLNELMDTTQLCIAMNLTMHDEEIRTMTVKEWREKAPDIERKYVMFALGKS